MKLPPGTRIKTPAGRLARVVFNDEEDRVHVRYCGSDRANPNEAGVFPCHLLTTSNIVPDPE